MSKLRDEDKSYLLNELKPYLENDDMRGLVLALCEEHKNPRGFSERAARLAVFLYELDVPIFEGMDGVVPDSFFAGTDIESVVIPSYIRTIGQGAFSDCDKLSAVVFKEGLEVIEPSAFEGSRNITKFDVPASVRRIGEYAFDCTELKEVYINNSDMFIDEHAFSDYIYYAGPMKFYVPSALYVEGTLVYATLNKFENHGSEVVLI